MAPRYVRLSPLRHHIASSLLCLAGRVSLSLPTSLPRHYCPQVRLHYRSLHHWSPPEHRCYRRLRRHHHSNQGRLICSLVLRVAFLLRPFVEVRFRSGIASFAASPLARVLHSFLHAMLIFSSCFVFFSIAEFSYFWRFAAAAFATLS